jgi:hypothetical protein
MGKWWWIAAIAVAAYAADAGADLRDAARRGRTQQVEALLARGIPVDSADKDGRTPLMLAARSGRPDTVKLLLAKGADAGARDRQGWTAYGLAVMEERDSVIKLFPPQPPIAAELDAKLSPENLYNSCFLRPEQLHDQVAGTQPDAMVTAAVREYASLSGKGLVRFVDSAPEVAVNLKVRPNVSCVQQRTVDNVSFAIDVKIVRTKDNSTLLEKTFGGGLKGLKTRYVSSPAQYSALFSEWAKAHASQIYWATVEAWLRAR